MPGNDRALIAKIGAATGAVAARPSMAAGWWVFHYLHADPDHALPPARVVLRFSPAIQEIERLPTSEMAGPPRPITDDDPLWMQEKASLLRQAYLLLA